jgi:hypothetical protein
MTELANKIITNGDMSNTTIEYVNDTIKSIIEYGYSEKDTTDEEFNTVDFLYCLAESIEQVFINKFSEMAKDEFEFENLIGRMRAYEKIIAGETILN